MATYDMGFWIRQIRREREITQEQLCAGLCPKGTLSRIERGLFTPSNYLFKALTERLGYYSSKHYGTFLGKEDFDLWKKREAIISALVKQDKELIERLLADLWGTKGFESGLGLQFLLTHKAALELIMQNQGKEKDEIDEYIRTIYEALKITIHDFDEQKISEYMLSYTELQAVNTLSCAYFFQNEFEKSAQVLYGVKESLDKFCLDQIEKSRYYPVILANLVEVLYELKRYEEIISLCACGKEFCIETRMVWEISRFSSYYGRCLAEQGKKEEAKPILREAYYSFRAFNRLEEAEALGRYFRETLLEEV